MKVPCFVAFHIIMADRFFLMVVFILDKSQIVSFRAEALCEKVMD